jgi:hypothetical protein
MTTDFIVKSGLTVLSDYTWDMGRPLETNPTKVIADSRTDYVSGYAPALKVVFESVINNLIYGEKSQPLTSETRNPSGVYIWNFGDYYNNNSNIAVLDCRNTLVEHTYILPGKYTVTLTNIQSVEKLPPDFSNTPCFGKHNMGWFWDNLVCTNRNSTTWDEAMCFPPATAVNPKPKWWDQEGDCFQKHCRYWNWLDLSIVGKNPVFWFQTEPIGKLFKRWNYEVNETPCEDELKSTIESTEQIAVKTAIVEVIEIKPIASIYNSTTPLTGVSPYTYTLSPKFCKPGSFPIDRIEWNPGDGSSIKVVTRYGNPDDNYFTHTNTFFDDPRDPRNYDFTYTINRNSNTYSIFYPSLTCYSASTNTCDSCSVTVGPIQLEPQPQNIHLLKTKNSLDKEVYGLQINKNITVLTNLTGSNNSTSSNQVKYPTSPVRQTTTPKQLVYFGQTGEGFPPEYTPTCTYTPGEYTDYLFLELEESEIITSDTLALVADREENMDGFVEIDIFLYK